MAKRSKWTVEVDKKIRKKFWRALTPTDRDMGRGMEDIECPVCDRYEEYVSFGKYCIECPFNKFKPSRCDTWRAHFACDYLWYNNEVESGGIPKSARPLFHKFYREFRKKIADYIVWV